MQMTAPHDVLLRFCSACFVKLGMPSEDAALTADNLVFASLRGVDSHGVMRMKIYIDRMRARGTDPRARPRVLSESATHVLLDGGDGVGQVATAEAMRRVIAKALDFGIAVGGVRNSNHFGAAAYFAMMALEHGMIGLALTNGTPVMAPSGGRQARVGNNPFAVAVPAGHHPPLVLDMATGAVAKGKIYVAQQEGKKIPLTWALDENGVPTDDPAAAARGLIQPMAGYKGYGLSLLLDILTGVLMGGNFGMLVGKMYGDVGIPTGTTHTCAALRVDRFLPEAEFRSHMDGLIDQMHSCPRVAGVERIYVPGEVEAEIEKERRERGIPLSSALADELRALGADLGVEAPC
jgi:ureidoglycolate dehydrogenase (NAD+)